MSKPSSRITSAKMLWILASALFAHQASAQWLTHDATTLVSILEEYGKDAQRWSQTIQQYKDQLQHYQQQLIPLQNLHFNLLQTQNAFPLRPDNWGVAEACPGAGGLSGVIEGAIQQTMPTLQNDVVKQQQQLCQQIVVAENTKYNKTVQLLARLIQYQSDYLGIESLRDGVKSSQGALAANDNDTQRFLARTSTDMQTSRTELAAYDAYIASLKWQQSLLAKRALDGDRTNLWGQVVDAAVLKAALSR